MSKGFTKDDATDEPLVVPARAPLPEGVPNYVTPRGLAALEAELAELERARARCVARAADGDADAAREGSAIATRAGELEIRLGAAELVAPAVGPLEVVRFGATVLTRSDDGAERNLHIVGVDEAAAAPRAAPPAASEVAFTAPIARALLGKRVGDVATVHTPRGESELEVVAIEQSG